MSATKDLGFALSKEQLCKLVLEYYGDELVHVTPPYQRFEALNIIAQIEAKSASTIQQTPYYDEMHEFYVQEYEFVK